MTHSSFSDIAQRGKVKARFSALLILQGILQGTSLKRSTNQGRGERSAENSPALFFTLDNTLLDPGFLLVSCKMNEIRASRSAKCEMRTTCICMMILLRRQLGICRTPSGFASCSATLSNTRCVSRNAQRHYATSLLFPSRYYARMPSRTIIRRGRTSTWIISESNERRVSICRDYPVARIPAGIPNLSYVFPPACAIAQDDDFTVWVIYS
jgi:hypothetical protein